MKTSTQWQLARTAAECYQTILTPAILGPFAQALVDFAGVQANEWVLDVGCGTGAAARYAAKAVGTSGCVIGVDINASMIEVARSLPNDLVAPIEWREADAVQLPLEDQSIDIVLCAQTLQFLPEKRLSLLEMRRVVNSRGRIALSLWCSIEDNPYFHALVEAVARHIGTDTASGLQSAFALSDADQIHTLLAEVGLRPIEMTIRQLDLKLPKLAKFVPLHISATPMDAGFERAPASVQQRVIQNVAEQLRTYEGNEHAHIPFRSHMILCRK